MGYGTYDEQDETKKGDGDEEANHTRDEADHGTKEKSTHEKIGEARGAWRQAPTLE
jgi:hypothetical protein